MLHICMCSEAFAYAMILNEKRGKLYAKEIICVFIAYCKGMKTYRTMYENKIKIKIEMLYLWKIMGTLEMMWRCFQTVVVVDESSKSPLFDVVDNP